MNDFLEFLIEGLHSLDLNETTTQWVVLGITIIGLFSSGGVVGYVLNRLAFRKRKFLDQVVIGVNILHFGPDGRHTLQLRTLLETNLSTLLDNKILERMVIKAAKKCTVDQMVLKLKSGADHALLLTKIQNAISSLFASEYVLHMLGHKFESQWVEFIATCEKYGGLKATKIRVVVFVKTDIERLKDSTFYEQVQVEVPQHRDRLRTLRYIAQNHLSTQDVVRGRVEILLAQEDLAQTQIPPEAKKLKPVRKPHRKKRYKFD